jgi:hypothetical protein
MTLITAISGLVPDPDAGSANASGVEKSTDTTLKKLTVSAGTLSPKFKASVTSYKLKLAAKKGTVKITPVQNHSKAKVQIKIGSAKYKTVKSATVKLTKGKSKTVTIKVTAQNGAVKTYQVKVTRGQK